MELLLCTFIVKILIKQCYSMYQLKETQKAQYFFNLQIVYNIKMDTEHME